MITISRPHIIDRDTHARLCATITIDGTGHEVWFEVEAKYKEYLCWERSDAFLVGILNYAMRNGHDITCEAPVGEYLYYNLTRHFIGALSCGSSNICSSLIFAQIDPTILPNAGCVGTGISCGVDSLHAIYMNSDPGMPRHKITHLAFNNVGAHDEGNNPRELYAARKTKARQFAEEFGFEYVESDSNIMNEIEQRHHLTHIYTSTFAILCLQKLYGVYYYASSYPYSSFSLANNELYTPDKYELLSVFSFSTDTLRIYSEGGSMKRFDKMRDIIRYEPSYKYLNVCVTEEDNCGVCPKCRRTLTDLDALNALDRYGEVFDIAYYRKNRSWYLSKACAYYWAKNILSVEAYEWLKKDITLRIRLKALPTYIFLRINAMRENKIKKGLLKLLAKLQ